MKLIDVVALLDILNKEKIPYNSDINYFITHAPIVDAEPVRHGHWKGKPIAGYSTVRCSQCGDVFMENSGNWNYCPTCGAKMDEVEDVKYRMDKQRRIRL